MSVLLLLLFGGFLFLGMFFLAADLLKMPYMKTEKALLDRGRNSKKGVGGVRYVFTARSHEIVSCNPNGRISEKPNEKCAESNRGLI